MCPSDDGELDEEAEWIYKHAFVQPPLSRQDFHSSDSNYSHSKNLSTVSKIREALNLMRNQQFEVPFIAFYRKEFIDPELNISDLWRIFQWDEKWMQLRMRKKDLLKLFEQVCNGLVHWYFKDIVFFCLDFLFKFLGFLK